MSAAITFDFHNTLADCPEWFDLEVKHLPSAYLTWHAASGDASYASPLLADADHRYRILRREIMDHGHELTAEQSLRVIFDDMQVAMRDADIEAGVAHLMREAASRARPIPGAVETVLDIAATGTHLGVVSSAVYHPFLEWTLDSFGIKHAFTTIVTSASAGFYKSRPEIYLHAAELLMAAPGQIVHVGDSLRFDVGGASRAGFGTVWLRHEGKASDGSEYIPDLTLSTLHGSASSILELLAVRRRADRP